MLPRVRRPLALLAASCGLALGGCSDDPAPDLALPSLGSARTVVAGLVVDGALREARVLDPRLTPTLRFDAASEVVARGTVTLAGYEATLASLGVREGPLVPVADGLPLPAPQVVLTRALDVESAPWAPAPALPPALADARFPAFGPVCPTFRQTPIAFPEAGVRYAVEIAGDQVLVGLDSGALVAIRPGEQPRPVTTSTAISDGIATAVPRPDGSVALIDAFCCVYGGTLAGDVITIDPPECPVEEVGGIVVDAIAHADSAGLTWLTYDGKVTAYTPGRGFRQLGRLEEREGAGRVTIDGAGVTFAGQATQRIGWAEPGGDLRLETVPVIGAHITALAHVPGIGTLVGDSGGHVFRRDGAGDYAELGDPGLFTGVTLFRPFPPDRLWVIGGSGEGAVWQDGQFCPLQQVGAGLVFYGPRLGDGWLLIGRRSAGSDVAVATWVRP